MQGPTFLNLVIKRMVTPLTAIGICRRSRLRGGRWRESIHVSFGYEVLTAGKLIFYG